MPKRAPFIDKKNSVTFKLIPRSQQDPLINDEDAPKNVLQLVESSQNTVKEKYNKRSKEEQKFGVYYDDDYDYMKHLKGADEFDKDLELVPVKENQKGVKIGREKSNGNKPRILLPSSVFESEHEMKEGMLAKGVLPVGPQPDWDPDIVEALIDEKFDHENPCNILDDDFVVQAMNGEVELIDESDCDSNGFLSDDEEEKKTVFTEYSLSSSVVPRSEALTTIDEGFELMYTRQYGDDNELGSLDLDHLDDELNDGDDDKRLLDSLLVSAKMKRQRIRKKEIKGFTLEKGEAIVEEDEEEEEEIELPCKENEYDAESIISTYSDIYNHPKLILPARRAPLTSKNLKKFGNKNSNENEETESIDERRTINTISELSFRPKNETSEERKKRKQELKSARRERRSEKKLNKLAFKMNDARIQKELINRMNSIKIV